MTTFSPKARTAAENSRRVNMTARAKLAKEYGGSVGDYFPHCIRKTILERSIPLASVAPRLLTHAKELPIGGEIPLDHPMFEKPAKKPGPKPKAAKLESDRELVLKLLQLAVKFL